MSARVVSYVVGVGLLLLVAGCAATPQRAEIPLGQWEGHGAFMMDSWTAASGETKAGTERHQYGRYPTQLKIEEVKEGSSTRVRIEVLSQHGKIEKMEGDRSHIIAVLERRAPLPDDTFALYRLVDLGIALDEKPPKMEGGPKGPTHATCMLVEGDLVFSIQYMPGFTDTFRFQGGAVLKDGTYYAEKGDGFVHWSEVLRPKR